MRTQCLAPLIRKTSHHCASTTSCKVVVGGGVDAEDQNWRVSLALTVGLRGPKKGVFMVQPRTQRIGEPVDKGVGLASSQDGAFSLSVIHC